MDAPPLKKGTQATVDLIPYLDHPDGAAIAIAVIKEKFAIDRHNRVLRTGGAETRLIDVPWDEDAPEISSTKYPSDIALQKPGTDVVVVGAAMAPYREPRRELDVLIRVGALEKALRVFGQRLWYRGAIGMTLTAPEPFEAVALKWELAFGGADFTEGKPPIEEPRNPVGRGVVRDTATLVHAPAPQIEDPFDLITGPKSRPRPAGVGPIARHWSPRRELLGTCDEQWLKERVPLLPIDLDRRFFHVAPPELTTREPLRGGERVQVLHMNDQGPLDFVLPEIHFFVGSKRNGQWTEHRSYLDTVLLEPNARALEMTWRAIVRLPRRAHELDFVQVHEKRVLS